MNNYIYMTKLAKRIPEWHEPPSGISFKFCLKFLAKVPKVGSLGHSSDSLLKLHRDTKGTRPVDPLKQLSLRSQSQQQVLT